MSIFAAIESEVDALVADLADIKADLIRRLDSLIALETSPTLRAALVAIREQAERIEP